MDPIRYVDLETGETHEERVYGAGWIRFLYGTLAGRLISSVVALPAFSRLYGRLQDRPASSRKVQPFIDEFGIAIDDFLPDEGGSPGAPYATFNGFFTRRVKAAARPIAPPPAFPAPCDARYFAYESLDASVRVPVKGRFFEASALVGDERWNAVFAGGPAFIARLCPVDYHRFHFPDDGDVLATWRIPGALHSVNPWALAFREDIFMVNERQVTILDTRHLGKLAYVEVGATCVGRIEQTHQGTSFARGDEKGMFLFGGSTVIVIGEKGRWRPDRRILECTANGIETYVRMGRALGTAS